MASELPV
jgi:hypothetical protein